MPLLALLHVQEVGRGMNSVPFTVPWCAAGVLAHPWLSWYASTRVTETTSILLRLHDVHQDKQRIASNKLPLHTDKLSLHTDKHRFSWTVSVAARQRFLAAPRQSLVVHRQAVVATRCLGPNICVSADVLGFLVCCIDGPCLWCLQWLLLLPWPSQKHGAACC